MASLTVCAMLRLKPLTIRGATPAGGVGWPDGGSRWERRCLMSTRESIETDARMEREVRGELDLDPRLEGSRVRVEVRDGAVTLTGTATSRTPRRTAQEAARRVVGVLYVANEIAVKAASS